MQLQPNIPLQGGKYKIEKVLGQGGFGITYLGIQGSLNRKVAIKEFFMKEYCDRDEATSQITLGTEGSHELVERFRQKFIKEAQIIAGLNNVHIISIYDIFEENGTAYYVMEYVGCGSLKDKIENYGAIHDSEALLYIRQIADALKYLHDRKIMHLDIKPSNILLRDTNEVVLIDFGISKRYDGTGEQTSSTPIGISKGFAPLEQYKQGGVKTFSPATDIYSLGATLFYLLTGNQPPEASDVNEEGLPTLSNSISKCVVNIITKTMLSRRKERPQSIEEFLLLLEIGDTSFSTYKEKSDETTIINSEQSILLQESDPTEKEDTTLKISQKKKTNNTKIHYLIRASLVLPLFLIVSFFIDNIIKPDRHIENEISANYTLNAGSNSIDSDTNVKDKDKDNKLKQKGTHLGFNSKNGKSLYWANGNLTSDFNITDSPSEPGGLFAWGEVDQTVKLTTTECVKYDYEKSRIWISEHYGGTNPPENICGTEFDIVSIKLGKPWGLPSKEEIELLIKNCLFSPAKINGVPVIKVTSKINGNYIYMPQKPGYGVWLRDDQTNKLFFSDGYDYLQGNYWTGSLVIDAPINAYVISATMGIIRKFIRNRYLAIRPVFEIEEQN